MENHWLRGVCMSSMLDYHTPHPCIKVVFSEDDQYDSAAKGV